MTEAQRKHFYIPAWLACARVNDWRMVGGRLLADLAAQRERCNQIPEPAAGVLFDVLAAAEKLARQDHCAVTADHLRHACNLVGTRREAQGVRHEGVLSSNKMTNGQLSQVVNLFNLLADPDDLTAVMHWLNPEEADRASLADHIAKLAHEAQLRAIAINAWNTSEWRDQDISRLRWLLREVKHANRPVQQERTPHQHGHHTTPF